MLDEQRAGADPSKDASAAQDDGRLTYTLTEAASRLGISRRWPTRLPSEASFLCVASAAGCSSHGQRCCACSVRTAHPVPT